MKKTLVVLLLGGVLGLSTLALADSKKKIKIIKEGTAFVQANGSSKQLGKVYSGESFEVLNLTDNWYMINYEGKVGYIEKQVAEQEKDNGQASQKQPNSSTSTGGATSPAYDYSPDKAVAEAEEGGETEDATISEGDAYAGESAAAPTGKDATFPCKHITFKNPKGNKTYDVADINDVSKIYHKADNKSNCFFIISKQEYRLYVYEKVGDEIRLDATFPVCYAVKTGPKTKQGDRSTPECSYDKPFSISSIQDASTWAHDFHDGRGSFLAYGHWFMRLDLSKSDCAAGCRSNKSIGIHGSSGNAYSVPGNDSEGCIRLRDADIKLLHDLYSQRGTKVVVKPYNQGRLDFEVKAIKALGNKFQTAKQGYKYYITK